VSGIADVPYGRADVPLRVGPWRQGARAVLEVARAQSWFIGVVLVYLAVGFAVGALYGQKVRIGMYGEVQLVLYANFGLFCILVHAGHALYRHRPAHPLRFLWTNLTSDLLSPRRFLHALPALVLMPLVLSMATSLKRMIPLFAPFSLDPVLVRLDQALHFGYHPWQLLQPMLGDPLITAIISNAYALPWFTLVLFVQFWQTFTLEPGRQQFLISFVLCWALLGNGLATVMSSAGPIYYGRLFDGPDPFAPLVSYLGTVADIYPLPSYLAQQYLWESYTQDFLRLGTGISAMPSLHISMGLLLVLATWNKHWSVRLGAIAYLAVLEVGAVHLGWHYAVDGYAAFFGTGAIWLAVGRALAWRERRRARREPTNAWPGHA